MSREPTVSHVCAQVPLGAATRQISPVPSLTTMSPVALVPPCTEGESVTFAVHGVPTTAELVADIDARAIHIGGHVMGVLSAAESIDLQPSANVEGELTASALRLADGAVFNGKAQTTKARPATKLQLAS